MGIKVSADHWVQLTYETEKGMLFTYAKKYQSWFPRSTIKKSVELYDEGKLRDLLRPDSWWIIETGKSWETRKFFANKKKLKDIPINQTRLFSNDPSHITMNNIHEKTKEITRTRRDRKKAMKRMRDNIGKHKFEGN